MRGDQPPLPGFPGSLPQIIGSITNIRKSVLDLERNPADVILLDLRMPGLDGMDVLKTIKQRWPESQVVVITGYPTIESAKEAVRMGAFNYIAKPVGPDEVVKAANEAMTQKRWTLRSVPTVSH